MEKRIEDLEVKVAFQEHTISTLSEIIREQGEEIAYLKRQIRELFDGLQQAMPSLENPPPPHY